VASEEEILEIRRREVIINAALRELLATGRISGEDPELAARESYSGSAPQGKALGHR
jgi:hypothetical protein